MKHLIDYSTYTTETPFTKPIINEKYGIPNSLKELTEICYKKVEDYMKNNIYITNTDFITTDIELKNLIIKIHYQKRGDIYATSSFGNFSDKKLNNSEINLYLDNININYLEVRKCILHELIHIYEIYNRIKFNSKKDLQWKISQSLMKLRNNYNDKFIMDFIYHIYLSFDHEINARVGETYIVLMDIAKNNNLNLMNELEKTSAWKYKNNLKNYDYTKYTINWELFKDFLIKLNKIINTYSLKKFNIHKIPSNNKDCEKILNNYTKLFINKSKYMENKLINLLKEVENDILLIDSYYVNIDNSKELSDKYITTYDIELKRKSKIYKIIRE